MKINKDKRIGNVLFIVEGSKTEFIILRKIFCNLLNYTYIEKRRNKLHSFYKENDIYSKIAVINTRESNISDKTLGQEYLDEVFKTGVAFIVGNPKLYSLINEAHVK